MKIQKISSGAKIGRMVLNMVMTAYAWLFRGERTETGIRDIGGEPVESASPLLPDHCISNEYIVVCSLSLSVSFSTFSVTTIKLIAIERTNN